MARRAAEQAAEHVAAALVRRQHTVGDEEGDGPAVVGDDPERDVVGGGASVAPARELLHAGDDAAQQVAVVVGGNALQQRRHPLETHAGVDVLRGQLGELPRLVPVVLDEDQVPDLDEARAAGVHAAAVCRVGAVVAGVGTAIDVDLRARPARARLAHLPEVLGVEAQHPRSVDVGHLRPQRRRLVVGRVHRRPERGLRELPDAGQELPRPRDRLALVIVAERPVTEHLEEGVVVRVAPHLLEVVVLAADAEALLRVGGTRVGPPLLAEEHLLELHHAGVDEEQARIVLGDERGARDDGVAALPEKVQEALADLVAGHHRLFLPARFRTGNPRRRPRI